MNIVELNTNEINYVSGGNEIDELCQQHPYGCTILNATVNGVRIGYDYAAIGTNYTIEAINTYVIPSAQKALPYVKETIKTVYRITEISLAIIGLGMFCYSKQKLSN
jgi:hypothetical protein